MREWAGRHGVGPGPPARGVRLSTRSCGEKYAAGDRPHSASRGGYAGLDAGICGCQGSVALLYRVMVHGEAGIGSGFLYFNFRHCDL